MTLFDEYGRRIPEGLQAKVCDANRNFRLNQPELERDAHYASRITRLHECLDLDTGITVQQLKAETERSLDRIRDDPRIAKITNGVWLPVIMPKLITDDLGTALEQYLEGVGESYAKTFSDRKFHNHCKGSLANEVSIVEGSRHDQLVERMRQGPVMGIYFPSSLQGHSIDAQKEQMSSLPKGFILSSMDTLSAMVMYLDILARDRNTPSLDMAALFWRSTDYSLGFRAGDDRLDFGSTDVLAYALGRYSGGLLFLG